MGYGRVLRAWRRVNRHHASSQRPRIRSTSPAANNDRCAAAALGCWDMRPNYERECASPARLPDDLVLTVHSRRKVVERLGEQVVCDALHAWCRRDVG